MNISSIKSKLKSYSDENDRNHHFTIIRFIQERFLYRLSQSSYKNNFLLKGGALIHVYGIDEMRYTRDIDFLLQRLENSHEKMKEIFYEVGNIFYPDGTEYLVDQMTISEIKKEGKYKGIRIKIPSRLGNIREQLQIDIGIGDHVTPGPQVINYPTIIKEFDQPELFAYSIETSIAEKFEAMISLGEYNSRMKDFYDVYHLISRCSNDVLSDAIKNTFNQRKTPLIIDHPIFNMEFYTDDKRVKRWNMFLKKNELNKIGFSLVHERIKENLEHIYTSILKRIQLGTIE